MRRVSQSSVALLSPTTRERVPLQQKERLGIADFIVATDGWSPCCAYLNQPAKEP